MFFHSGQIRKARELIAASKRPLVLTGAGLSLASGVPTFRDGPKPLWENPEMLKYAFRETFVSDPEGSWRAHEAMRNFIDQHEPNIGHRAIHELGRGRDLRLFTQNVDGYHQRSGDDVKELHGTIHVMRCCVDWCPQSIKSAPGIPAHHACARCGNWLRHDVVWFDELVRHVGEFEDALATADLVLLVGTSGLVTKTGDIARQARARNIPVIEINPALCTPATRWTTISLRKKAENVLPELVQ